MESRAAVLPPRNAILGAKETLFPLDENPRKKDAPAKPAEPLPLTSLADIFKILQNEGTL